MIFRSIVQNLQISVFVVSGNPLASDKALTGYAGQRERVYHQPNDAALFLEELDKVNEKSTNIYLFK